MNTYNNTIINTVVDQVNYILQRLSDKDHQERKLKLVNYEVIDEDDTQLFDLIEEQGTLGSKLKFKIECVNKDGSVIYLENQLLIPKMINNVFIIGGKPRIAINLMVNDGEVRIYKDSINISQDLRIEWNFPKGVDPSYNPEFFKVTTCDLDGNTVEFEGIPENYEIYKSLLKLTQRQIWKLKVKLGRDDIPEYLTYELVGELFNYGWDAKRDLIIDKKITTIGSDFKSFMSRGDSKKKIMMRAGSFYNTGDISFAGLQSLILSYFRAAQSKCIEIPSGINPLIYDSLKYKIVFPDTVVYNKTFTDLVDPVNTPENNSVNLINELNVCVNLEGENIMYTCYDFKTRKSIQIPYLEYLTKKVLKCEYFNYETLEVITSPTYEYKQYLKDYKVDNLNEVSIDIIEPSPDERLSYTTRRIPLINVSDSVRVAMGCSMLKQAIQTDGCEPRLVSSGNDYQDYESAHSLIRYQGIHEGEVTAITEDYIDIKDKQSGLIVKVNIPKPAEGLHSNLMTNDSIVNVGDTIIPNQIIISPSTMKGNSYNLGINARTVYMSYLGYTYEDGVVISESYAKKCTQYRKIEILAPIRSNDKVQGIIQIGSKVHSLDKIIDSVSPPRSSGSIIRALEGGKGNTAVKAIEVKEQDTSTIVPNNIDLGYITDVKIIKKSNAVLSEYTLNTIDKYIDNKEIKDDYLNLPDKYRNIHANDYYDFKKYEQAVIKIVIISVNPMRVGDKSSNSWGGKGEISLILPDELMPRLDLDGEGNGPAFDIIMNPAAVVARKNPSQLYECLLTKIIEEIHDTVKTLVNNNEFDIARNFLKEYYNGKFDKYSDDQLKEASTSILNFRMNVGSFSKISYDTILKWMDELDVKEDDKIYCPSVVIYQSDYNSDFELNKGTSACSPEYAKEHGINGKLYELGFVEHPVITGMSYMYKLHHSGIDVGKATSEAVQLNDPILGRGLKRDEGQKIGEMELWSLKSYGTEKFVTENNPEIIRDENLFLNELMLTGLVLKDQMGIPYGIPNRDVVAKNIKHIKNNLKIMKR